MGLYGANARSHGRKQQIRSQLHNQKRQSSIPAHYMRLKERIARSSAAPSNSSLTNFFGPHLIISPHDRLNLQKSNSLSTRPKAVITVSTHHHHDFRIRPFLFSHASSTAAALRHTKTGQICKSTPLRSNSAASRSNINHLCVLPLTATSATTIRREDQQQQQESTLLSHLQQGVETYPHHYQAPQELRTVDGDHFMGGGGGEEEDDEDEDEDVDDEDETEDVEIDIDGVGRSGYGISNTGFSPATTTTTTSTTLGDNSAAALSIHAAVRRQQLFGHEGIEFGTRSGSAEAATVAAGAAFVFGSGTGFESSSQQQIPSLSSSVCSTSSTLSTPPADADLEYSPNFTIRPQNEHKEELVKLKREAFQELASQTQRFDDLFIAKMIHWESLCAEEKAQWLERGHSHHDGAAHTGLQQQQQEKEQHYGEHQHAQQQHQQGPQHRQYQWIKQQPQVQAQEQEMDDLVRALECRATVKDYSALIAFEQQAEIQRRTLMEQY
ncbi:hypothetical protein BGX24_000259 [Mortierella sp. AD032]|nr:hypothetical protein BGX24_000259 [Mortierella sp. AD032]